VVGIKSAKKGEVYITLPTQQRVTAPCHSARRRACPRCVAQGVQPAIIAKHRLVFCVLDDSPEYR
jgi:hypothetical protein